MGEATKLTTWGSIKGYNRDYMFLHALKGKTVGADIVVGEGKKLGLKQVTCELKMRRWLREGKAKATKDGKLAF